jgi:acetoacetyl-[acyl-carrier protein] synthase
VADVFINADGHKKSISAPGVGNYITLGKALALVEKLIGTDALQQRTCVQAHGTSTPQNRVTESHVLNESALAFGIENWPVAAVKCYLGHSQGTAGGDQLNSSLGIWQYGYIPGIGTIDHVADDVHTSQLNIQSQHHEVGTQGIDAVFLNSKGFGGNNASAILLSPHTTKAMLTRKHGQHAMTRFQYQQETTLEQALIYDEQAIQGNTNPIYQFGKDVLVGEDLSINHDEIRIPGYDQPISLDIPNPYKDMSLD